MLRAVYFLCLLAFFLPSSVMAQGESYNRFLEVLNETNHARPEQSPAFERSKEVLSDRVLDSRNKVIGEVLDVIVDSEGEIATLYVEFNRLKLGTDEVFINYKQMRVRPASNGYKMGYEDDQIKELFPSLLAGMETASGNDVGLYSLQRLNGARVKSRDGRYLGKVEDVLFDDLGGKAELLFVAIEYGRLKGKGVAVPFDSAEYRSNGKRLEIVFGNAQADALIDFAKRD